MGKFMAVGLTDLLESSGMNGVPAFVGLALLSAFLCMFIASGSAIWSILAPIFVPMFMLLGYDPALTQMAYRIGDASTNMLSPLFPYLPLVLAVARKYDKNLFIAHILQKYYILFINVLKNFF